MIHFENNHRSYMDIYFWRDVISYKNLEFVLIKKKLKIKKYFKSGFDLAGTGKIRAVPTKKNLKSVPCRQKTGTDRTLSKIG